MNKKIIFFAFLLTVLSGFGLGFSVRGLLPRSPKSVEGRLFKIKSDNDTAFVCLNGRLTGEWVLLPKCK